MSGLTLAVIPARGGSKRVPGKNIRLLFGKPLIAYTIEAARSSGLFAQIIVSTDSQEIADIALTAGAEVPFLREAALADDFTPVSAVTRAALERLDPDGRQIAWVAQLMPNCPLRNANDVIDSHRQFIASGADSQISVVRYGWQNPWWAMRRNAEFRLDPLFKAEMTSRSQDLSELYCPTGVIWWARSEVLRQEGTFHTPNRTGWEIPWQRGIDIDTPEDWQMTEVLFKMEQDAAKSRLEGG